MKIPFLHRRKIPPEGYCDIRKIEYSPDRGLQVIAKHPLFSMFINDLVEMFYKADAVNFFSLCAWHPKAGELEIIVKRREGKTQGEVLRELRAQYEELIMAVSKKFPEETRHQTALRYIMERENSSNDSGAKQDI